jgi:hypothetical protein
MQAFCHASVPKIRRRLNGESDAATTATKWTFHFEFLALKAHYSVTIQPFVII